MGAEGHGGNPPSPTVPLSVLLFLVFRLSTFSTSLLLECEVPGALR